MIANDARCACEVKSGISIAQAAFDEKKTPVTKKMDLV
jgi:hypothetical protein